jgi:IS5 family transposase
MHQTRKGNQWYFGLKAHVGMDSKSKLIHSVVATAANVHDSQALPDLLHGKETRVWGDSAYQGQRAAMIERAPRALDFTNRRGAPNHPLSAVQKGINRTKSRVALKSRARVQRRQAPLGIQQSPLPRDREKPEPPLRRVRLDQSLRRARQAFAIATGVVRLEIEFEASRSTIGP